jgi:hypothetical protein
LNKLALGRFVTVQVTERVEPGFPLQVNKVPVAEAGVYFEGLKGNIGYLLLFDPRKAASLEQRLRDTCAELGYYFA